MIAAEIQCFGANTFVTVLRGGKGIFYREVLMDICDKLKVNYSKDAKTAFIEDNLLLKILRDALEKMSTEDLKALAKELNINDLNCSTEILLGAFQTIFSAGGFKSYQLTLIIANAISRALFGKGLTFAANASLAKTMSILTGPVGWAITGAWTLIDIAGPAFRVTLPAVIQIAVLRKKHSQEDFI